MDKFDQLKNEYDQFANCVDILFATIDATLDEESTKSTKIMIARALCGGMFIAIPDIIDERLPFKDTLLRLVIGMREFLTDSLTREVELSDYVDPGYITLAIVNLKQFNILKESNTSKETRESLVYSFAASILYIATWLDWHEV